MECLLFFFFSSAESVKLAHNLKSHSGDTTPVVCCTHHLADSVATYFLALAYWVVQWSWFARVNALCNLSCKKSREVAASLPDRFLSRHCFTLCITREVEPRIAKQYKCNDSCSCKNYRAEGMEGGKKVSLCLFFGWSEDCEFVAKIHFGATYSTSNKLLLVARHILTTGLQKCLLKLVV